MRTNQRAHGVSQEIQIMRWTPIPMQSVCECTRQEVLPKQPGEIQCKKQEVATKQPGETQCIGKEEQTTPGSQETNQCTFQETLPF